MCCRLLSLAGAARFPIPGRGHQQSVMVPLQSPNTVEFVQSLQMWFCFYHFFYFFIKHQYSWQHNNKTPSSDEQSIASDSQAHMQERNMDCKMGIQLLRYFAVHNVCMHGLTGPQEQEITFFSNNCKGNTLSVSTFNEEFKHILNG